MATHNGSPHNGSRQHRSASKPRAHIVLVPGFGGFDALGKVHYYAGITRLFRDWTERHAEIPAVLHYFDNLPTAAVVTRAKHLQHYLATRMARHEILAGDRLVLVGHSTGGLDIRQLLYDLDHANVREITVDGNAAISPDLLRGAIQGVVFVSVPHWGTNIAEWVHSHCMLRSTVVRNLELAFKAGSQSYLLDRAETALADEAACVTDTDVMLALRDALAESNEDWSDDPTRVADAQEAASELQLYFRQISTNFHAIEDLTPGAHTGTRSPAQFAAGARSEEMDVWRDIETISFLTVGPRAFQFPSGGAAPVFEFSNVESALKVLRPSAQCPKTDIAYRLCYMACAGGPLERPPIEANISRVLGHFHPQPLELWDNDGIVNTVSMLWERGDNILVQADHLDIVGHFERRPPRLRRWTRDDAPRTHWAYDTLKSHSQFQRTTFEEVWSEIFSFATTQERSQRERTSVARPVPIVAPATAVV